MNKFRSSAENKKWASLESAASTSFKRMLDGTAKDVDFRAVTRLLQDQSKLAKAVFEEGVAAIEQMTDEFMDKQNKARTDKGQKPLSRAEHTKLYKEVYSNIMKQEAPDLIGTLQDIIEQRITEGFDDITEKTQAAINKGFDRLGTFSVKDKEVPTTDDMIALHEASAEDAENRDDRKWPHRLSDIKAAVEHAVETKFMEVINRIRGDAGPRNSSPAIGYSPTAKANSSAAENWEVLDAESSSNTASNAKSIPLVQLSPKAEAAVIDAQSDQSKFHDTVTEALQDAKQKSNDDDSETEEKKADSWFRRMGSWLKDKMPKSKSGGKLSSLLSGLGKAFLVSLMAPELLKTIANKAREYLTMDNITKFIKETWDSIYSTGESIVNWILEKLGLDMDSKKKKGLDPTRNTMSERIDGKLALYEKKYSEAQTHLQAAGGDVSKLSETDQHSLKALPSLIKDLKRMQAENRAKGDMGLAGPKAAPGTLAGGGNGSATISGPPPETTGGGYKYDPATGKMTKIDDTALRPVEGATGGYMLDPKTNQILTPDQVNQRAAATTISSAAAKGQPPTTVAPAKPVTKGEPVFAPNENGVYEQVNPTPSNNAPLQASTALTLGSIPMHAGVDDTLHLMNIGALS